MDSLVNTAKPAPGSIHIELRLREAKRRKLRESYTAGLYGQFHYSHAFRKEISTGAVFAHFGAMQQTDQPYASVSGQILCGL